MKRHLKAEILETARELFDERGYNAVSMRDIAQVLGISVGNLTYHYKRKEELMEAVVSEQYSRYRHSPAPQNLKELNHLFQKILNHQERNTYYFRHYQQLSQLSPKVHAMQQGVINDLYESLQVTFAEFRRQGWLQADRIPVPTDGEPSQTDLFIDALVSVCILGTTRNWDRRLSILWSVITPFLTQSGQAELQQLEPVTGNDSNHSTSR